jgi:hypothetical protein
MLTNLRKILEPSVDLVFSERYILGPKMIKALPGLTLAKDIV